MKQTEHDEAHGPGAPSDPRPTPSSTARRVGGFTAMRLIGQGAEFLAFVVFARRLGTAAFGELSVAFLIARYAGILADWGASLKGTRDVASRTPPEAVRALVLHRLVVSIGLSVGFAAVAVASGRASLAPLALAVAARGTNRDWLALGRERAARSALPLLTQGVLLLVLAPLSSGLLRASAAIGIAYTLAATLSVILNRLPPSSAPPTKRRVDPWFLIILVADQIYASSDVLLLAALGSASEAGIYAAVYRFPNAWILVLGLITTSLLPTMTRALLEESGRFARLRRQALVLGARGALVLVLLGPIAWFAVPYLYGWDYAPGRTPLLLLMAATAVATSTVGLGPLYFAAGHERAFAGWSSLVAAVNLGLNLALIPRLGMTGAAISTLVAQMLVAGFYLVATGRIARTRGPAHRSPTRRNP